ncbi:MAG: hypothetical protein ABFS41_13970 [Myxococcota bacterium]
MRSWQAEEWREVRDKGKGAFLLRYGFLGRGLPLGVVIAIAIESALGSPMPDALTSEAFLARLFFCIAVMTASGCFSAHVNWNLHERRHAGPA